MVRVQKTKKMEQPAVVAALLRPSQSHVSSWQGHTNKQASTQASKQTQKQTCKQAIKQANRQTSKQQHVSVRLHTSARLYVCMHDACMHCCHIALCRLKPSRHTHTQAHARRYSSSIPPHCRSTHAYFQTDLSPSFEAHQTLDLPSKTLVIGITPPVRAVNLLPLTLSRSEKKRWERHPSAARPMEPRA